MEPTLDRRRQGAATRRFAAALLGAALVFTDGAARAAEGIYLDLSLGIGALGDLDDSDGFTSEFWPGPTVSGALGYKWRWLRFEGEIFYGFFLLDEQAGPGGSRPPPPPSCFLCGTTDVNGDVSALAIMANAYLDFDLSERVRLYLGGGVGGAQVAADYHFDVTVLGIPTDEEIDVVDDRDGVLAYQARAGLTFGLSERSEFYLGYRYFATGDLSFDVEGGGRLEQDGLGAHIGEIGYRVYF